MATFKDAMTVLRYRHLQLFCLQSYPLPHELQDFLTMLKDNRIKAVFKTKENAFSPDPFIEERIDIVNIRMRKTGIFTVQLRDFWMTLTKHEVCGSKVTRVCFIGEDITSYLVAATLVFFGINTRKAMLLMSNSGLCWITDSQMIHFRKYFTYKGNTILFFFHIFV